jgi:hypothetical protein
MIIDSTTVIGKTTKWMEWDYLFGQTTENILASTKTIKKKDMEYLNGQTKENTKDTGVMENSTGKVNFSILRKVYGKKVFGMTERELDGLDN